MSNNMNGHNATLYATPKMVAGSVSADVIWQFCGQFVDPHFEDRKIGQMDYEWFTMFIYPVALMLLIGGMAYAHSRYYSGYLSEEDIKRNYPDKSNDARNTLVKTNNEKLAENIEQDKAVGGAVLFGMAGWMLGYLAADEEYGLGFNTAETAVAVGVGSTITGLLFSLYVDQKSNNLASKATYGVLAASIFLSAVSWYLSYILPGIMLSNGFSENKVAGGCVATLATGIGSAASLGVLYLWEHKDDKKGADNKQPATSSLKTPLLK